MKSADLVALGIKPGPAMGQALHAFPPAVAALGREGAEVALRAVVAAPAEHLNDPHFANVAAVLAGEAATVARHIAPRAQPVPYRVWGDGIEPGALEQMRLAATLPVTVAGALMPDAHVGYGLPIGGVLATEGAVIPYAVGVDIACRMRLSVFDLPAGDIERLRERLERVLERQTVFGIGGVRGKPADHAVLAADWGVSPVTRRVFDKAAAQLGTSGSGNHFVEWGVFANDAAVAELGLPAGVRLALLSHSGSRGSGAAVAEHYSKLAMSLRRGLPPELSRLAWLDLESDAGREYWAAMELMGQYAAANHAVIHEAVAGALGEAPVASVENHHNFAWKETHGGREVVVHRKGATPAGAGVLGVIPGSMAAPGYLVRGRGVAESLNSASHGAGRRMSRTAARGQFVWGNVNRDLAAAGVKLLSAGLDEAPGAYKDIAEVMAAQADLVEVLGRFDPRIVKMAPAGEAAED